MQKHLLYINLFAITSALALSACADEVENAVTPDMPEVGEKTPIELSVGGVDAPDAEPLTRAVITDGTGKKLRAFSKQTRLFFAIVAEDGNGGKKYGFNYGTASAATADQKESNGDIKENTKSAITFPDNYLYWDDAYARESKVSVYSIAVANQVRGNVKLTPDESIAIGTESPGIALIQFSTTDPGAPTFKWQIGDSDGASAYKQDQNIFEWADLVFSNNIANYDTDNTDATKDKRLKFHTETGVMYHKFDQGELIYYHALTQFTIKIKCGDGFKGDGNDFKFTDGAGKACTTPNNSFGLNGFYGANGVFYIGKGEFDSMTESNIRNYTSIYKVSETHQKETAEDYYVLKAYVFPGTDMTGSKDDAFSFIIDGNKYDVSLANLYNAIKSGPTNVGKLGSSPSKVDASILDEITVGEGGKKLKAGYNYEFTFTVGKTKIKNITAQVVDWENVSADNINPSNARIKLQLEERGDNQTTNVAFYRAADNIKESDPIDDEHEAYDWKSGYTNLNATYPTSSDHWTTNYFWESSKDFYHFRAVMPNTKVVKTADSKDYFEISSSSCANANSYDAVAWGAPMLDVAKNDVSDASTLKWNYGPTKNGFDADDNDNVASGLPSGTTHQIYKAIGPTEDPVKLILFHMMSGVHFTIKTDESSSAKVQLYNPTGTKRTKVELVGYYPSGKVLLGSGLVNEDGSISSLETGDGKVPPYEVTCATTSVESYANQEYFFSAVPQGLSAVKLYITTPDNNQYIVDLYNVAIAIDSDNNDQISSNNIANPYTRITDESDKNKGKYRIDRWYPGFKYNYTFKLLKTGITDLQATIVAWENVEADEETVVIQ